MKEEQMSMCAKLFFGLVFTFLGVVMLGLIFMGLGIGNIEKSVELDSVVRIFMRDYGSYTFYSQYDGDDRVYQYSTYHAGSPMIYTDVAPGEKARVKLTEIYRLWGLMYERTKDLEFHLHQVDEVNGAGWQRQEGKFTRTGQTMVIE